MINKLLEALEIAGFDTGEPYAVHYLASELHAYAENLEERNEIENQIYNIGLLMDDAEASEDTDRFQELEIELADLERELENL
jgi:hypothetical protein